MTTTRLEQSVNGADPRRSAGSRPHRRGFWVVAFACIAALLIAGHLSDLYGRRRLLLPAVVISIVSALVFIAWKSLAGLLAGRLINGISIGIVASTATAYLAELHAIGRPQATARKAQLTASAVNIGGLALGALVAGVSRNG